MTSNHAISQGDASNFERLLEAAPDGILVVDNAGTIVLANRRCFNLFGYETKELIGQKIEVLVPEYIRSKHADLRDSYFKAPHVRPIGIGLELMAARKDGTGLPVEISLSPFQFSGRPCAIAIVRDTSVIRQLDHELKRNNRDLKRSNEELESFAYVASHDLQEPLRSIAGYVQLLKRRYANELDKEASEYIDFTVEGVKRMQTLIQDLLRYSRLSTRTSPFVTVDCEEILKVVLANLETAALEKKATITHDKMPSVKGDRTQLIQLFQNLIGNALKFHRDDTPPIIHVSASNEGNYWRFAVTDNGIGISQEYAEKVFVIFQRLHARDKYPGTGIGLALCKKIVERHSGEIWFDSKLGSGTSFFIKLPAQES